MSEKMNVGIYLFENMTMLDAYGPLQALSFPEEFNTFTFANTTEPFLCDSGVQLMPQYGLDDCPPLDIIVMPGGGDVLPPMQNAALMAFLRERGPKAKYITSVCSGALILAEAGLLDGYEATTHWAWKEVMAASYPAITVVDKRVAIDRNRISGGGITAGIDFALTLIAEVIGEPQAQGVQLLLEYRPAPPFDAGSPDTAPAPVLGMVQGMTTQIMSPLREFLSSKNAA